MSPEEFNYKYIKDRASAGSWRRGYEYHLKDMVFDTRTVDTMKESLAHYFNISCEELVEFIKEAADNTQAKSRGLFNADIFTEELDAFLENIEVTEQIDGVMCFHFSRRINNTAPDFRIYNLKDLLLSDNPMSSFLNDSGYEFFEEDGHLAFKYNGIEYFPEAGDERVGTAENFV